MMKIKVFFLFEYYIFFKEKCKFFHVFYDHYSPSEFPEKQIEDSKTMHDFQYRAMINNPDPSRLKPVKVYLFSGLKERALNQKNRFSLF
jgi:hypothetical protein